VYAIGISSIYLWIVFSYIIRTHESLAVCMEFTLFSTQAHACNLHRKRLVMTPATLRVHGFAYSLWSLQMGAVTLLIQELVSWIVGGVSILICSPQ
jgi:hypothetical protein